MKDIKHNSIYLDELAYRAMLKEHEPKFFKAHRALTDADNNNDDALRISVAYELELAPKNKKSAQHVLLIAAKYFRDGKALPPELAEYLAGAFEKAIKTPHSIDPHYDSKKDELPGRALLIALNLQATQRRAIPEDISFHVWCRMEERIRGRKFGLRPDLAPTLEAIECMSQNKAAKEVSEEFSGISVATAKRCYVRWQKVFKHYRASVEKSPPPNQ